MAAAFIGMVILDAWLDGSVSDSIENKPVQATLICLTVICLMVPAQLELAQLTKNTGVKLFKSVALPAGMLFSASWYIGQFFTADWPMFHLYYMLFVSAFSLLMLFVVQAVRFGTEGTVANCSVSFFSIMYLGFLSGFFVGIRMDFGYLWLLMFVTVVKCSDIGAYTIGKMFGKRKFVPKISPAKTWEGLIGSLVFALIVSLAFAMSFGIMTAAEAVVFGLLFGFLAQLGDLAESMIKRDAEQKDSSGSVPGFGGLLDVLDSPLATAPAAYLFFMIVERYQLG